MLGREEALKALGKKCDAGLGYIRNKSRENSMSLVREGKTFTPLDVRRTMAFECHSSEASRKETTDIK